MKQQTTRILSVGVGALIFLLAGCASIIKGTNQSVTVNSDPDGADVMVDGMQMGTTPVTLVLKKNKYNTILVQKKGYKSQTLPLGKAYDVIAILNFFWDCSTTDFLTGAAYEYQPSSYHFKLKGGSRAKSDDEDDDQ